MCSLLKDALYKQDDDNVDNIAISARLFCKIAGVSRRTFFNWKKSGKIQTKKEKNDTKDYVILSKSSVLLLKKETSDESIKELIKDEIKEQKVQQLLQSLTEAKSLLNTVSKELRKLL